MFPLHDRTRRWICRAGFLLGGVLPMMAVLAWAASIHTGAHKDCVRARLEAALGLTVRFDQVSYPRPDVTLLSNLELGDPQTGETLLCARALEIGGNAQTQTLIASQPEVDAARLNRFWQLLAQRLERQLETNQPALRISAAELTLRGPQQMQTLVDCVVQVDAADSQAMATASFQLAGAAAAEPARIYVQRNNSSGGPTTTLKIESGGTPLPCSLLATLLHRANYLGPSATLRGSVWMEDASAGWQAEFVGQFEQLDLNAAISDQFPHQLGGMANLTLDHTVVRNGRLEEATGTIHAGPGVVSQSLLRSAQDSLRMRPGNADNSSTSVLPYEELAAAFVLDAKGLQIHGQCGAGEEGVVIRSHGNVLLADSLGGPLPIGALVQALVPDSRVQVPATRQTDWLLRSLPLPDVLPRDPQAAPSARLRGSPELH